MKILVRYIVILSNSPHFLWVYRRDNSRGMFGEHENTRVFSQNPKWVITPLNPKKVWSIAFINNFKFSMSLPAQQTIGF